MTFIGDVFKELLGMFLADIRLSAAILLLVAIAGGLIVALPEPFLGGGVLLFGCLGILVEAASREARSGARR